MKPKTHQVVIRMPHDLHTQLTEAAERQLLPVSRFIITTMATAINYAPKACTPRSFSEEPVVPRFWDGTKYVSAPDTQQKAEEEDIPWYDKLPVVNYDGDSDDFTEEEMADLQRRAASAPVKLIDSLGK